MKLLGAERVIVDINKLRDYCLSLIHPRCGDKARVFASSLASHTSWAEIEECVTEGNRKVGKMREEVKSVSDWQARAYGHYKWIVADPDLLGGRLAVRGTRLSVSLILECLANGMTVDDINESYAGAFPPEALPEILQLASELTGAVHVAA